MKSRRELLEMAETIDDLYDKMESMGERHASFLARYYSEINGMLTEYARKTNHFNTYRELIPKMDKIISKANTAQKRGDIEASEIDVLNAVMDEVKRGLKFKDSRIIPNAQEKLKRLESDATITIKIRETIEEYRQEYGKLSKSRGLLQKELQDTKSLIEAMKTHSSVDPRALEDFVRRQDVYNPQVAKMLEEFECTVPAVKALGTLMQAASEPLIDFPQPPDGKSVEMLIDFCKESELSDKPLALVLEYSNYSGSKLKHYVEDVNKFHAVLDPCHVWLQEFVEQRRKRLLRVSLESEPTMLTEQAAVIVRLLTRLGRTMDYDVSEPVGFLRWLQNGLRSGALDGARAAALRTGRFTAKELKSYESGTLGKKVESIQKEIAGIDKTLEGLPKPEIFD